jgi:hypothetical protein
MLSLRSWLRRTTLAIARGGEPNGIGTWVSRAVRGEACHPSFSTAIEHPLVQLVEACGTLAVTPEAAGSSPVDPANYPSATKELRVRRRGLLAKWPEAAGPTSLQDDATMVEDDIDLHGEVAARF